MKPKEIIRVAFVEDDKRVRDNFVAAINKADGFSCVGSYSTAESAFEALPGVAPDVVVLDIHLPGLNGIECLRMLKPLCPGTQFLMLTAYEESELIFRSLLAGASGYLLKRTGMQELFEAIRQVREGCSPMSGAIARRVVQYFNQMGAGNSGMEQLSPREREVLEHLARGSINKEIAEKLSISVETVRMNVKHIYAKLHVHSRSEAVAKFLRRP
jgi:DNA-binding NarL/FixJ family response regulator